MKTFLEYLQSLVEAQEPLQELQRLLDQLDFRRSSPDANLHYNQVFGFGKPPTHQNPEALSAIQTFLQKLSATTKGEWEGHKGLALLRKIKGEPPLQEPEDPEGWLVRKRYGGEWKKPAAPLKYRFG
jgi:hypothetical protein